MKALDSYTETLFGRAVYHNSKILPVLTLPQTVNAIKYKAAKRDCIFHCVPFRNLRVIILQHILSDFYRSHPVEPFKSHFAEGKRHFFSFILRKKFHGAYKWLAHLSCLMVSTVCYFLLQ